MHGPTRKNKNVIASPATKIIIRNVMWTRDRTKANATSTRSESRRIPWPQWNEDRKARKETHKTISRNYSIDLALYILKQSTQSSNASVFANLSNNGNWKKTKRRKINKTMKMATKMEPWDSWKSPRLEMYDSTEADGSRQLELDSLDEMRCNVLL